MGLGACWAGYFMRAVQSDAALIEALALPAGHHVFGALMVGYPAHRYVRIPSRRAARVTWRM